MEERLHALRCSVAEAELLAHRLFVGGGSRWTLSAAVPGDLAFPGGFYSRFSGERLQGSAVAQSSARGSVQRMRTSPSPSSLSSNVR